MTGPVPYRSVDLSRLVYGDIAKDMSARLYVVPIQPPIVIQTTPVALQTSLEDADIPFAYIAPDAALRKFLADTETVVGDACVANKHAWFASAKNLDDEVLRRGFKSFFSDAGFKIKVPAEIPCFDANKQPIGREDVGAGTVVRLVLELSRVCFGKHEYGVTWKAVQAQVVPSVCLIDDTVDDDTAGAGDDKDSDIEEFL